MPPSPAAISNLQNIWGLPSTVTHRPTAPRQAEEAAAQ